MLISIGGQNLAMCANAGIYNGFQFGGYNTPASPYPITEASEEGIVHQLNNWYLIVGTRSDTTMNLYVNGVLSVSASTNNTLPLYDDISSVFTIGCRDNISQYISGMINDVRIYKRALKQTEITALYNESNPVLPANAGIITGITSICQGQNSVSYKVPKINNATSYIWTLPTGATGTSITDSITVDYSASAVSGNITVKGSNTNGDGTRSTLAITVNPSSPANAGTISGDTAACQGENSVIYTVPSISNATSYDWILPTGATGTSTTNSIEVNFGSSAVSGNIEVYGQNGCGVGNGSLISVSLSSLPANAGTISGTTSVCQGQNSVLYSVPTITNATSYIWTLPAGVTGISTSNSITVNFGVSAVSGNITVQGNKSCGVGAPSSLAITVASLPANAGSILGGSTECVGQDSVLYAVSTITNATSYIWTLPTGVTGTSSTNSIIVNYSGSAVSGNITVKGNNTCGNGVSSSLAIMVNRTPAKAGTITGLLNVCQGQNSVSYTVPTIPSVTSYVWILHTGVTGTSTTNSIKVNYGPSAVSGGIEVNLPPLLGQNFLIYKYKS